MLARGTRSAGAAIVLALAVGMSASLSRAATEADRWTLTTDDTELRIAVVDGQPVLERLRVPGDRHDWLARPIPVPLLAGESSVMWRFESGLLDNRSGTLMLRFLNDKPDMRYRLFFQAQPGPGPVRQWAEVENRSSQEVKAVPPPCLAVSVSPGGPATVWWINRGGNDASMQGGTFTEPVARGGSQSLQVGQGGVQPVPWMAVQVGQQRGLYVGWEYSGRGTLRATAGPDGATVDLTFSLAESQLPIPAGGTLWIPPALVGCYRGDVDDGSYSLHRFYLDKLRPPMPRDCPDPLLTYNVFFGGTGKDEFGNQGKNEALLLTHLNLAREFGFEAFVPDAIWFPGDWRRHRGPWIWDAERYPNGIKPFQEFCRLHGMKFGLWCAWGRTGDQAADVTRQVVAENKLDYFKSDMDGLIPGGGYAGVLSYNRVQDSLRKTFPGLILENCSGGGTIKDFGAMSRTHYVVTTDVLSALPDRMSIYDSTFAFPPMVLQAYTWLLHDKPGPYLWRSGMMGAWVLDIPPRPDQAESIKKATAVYKSWIRPILRDCKVHHILPRPNGKRWDGLFYWGPKLRKGVLFIFRPHSDEAVQVVKLKGLEPERLYWVWCEDGSIGVGEKAGKELMEAGLKISLPEQNTSDLIFLQDAALGRPAELDRRTQP